MSHGSTNWQVAENGGLMANGTWRMEQPPEDRACILSVIAGRRFDLHPPDSMRLITPPISFIIAMIRRWNAVLCDSSHRWSAA